MQILEPKSKEKMPKLSEEDEKMWKAATKQYNQLKLAEHRVWQTDLQVKIELKNAALAAMPGALPPPCKRRHDPSVYSCWGRKPRRIWVRYSGCVRCLATPEEDMQVPAPCT